MSISELVPLFNYIQKSPRLKADLDCLRKIEELKYFGISEEMINALSTLVQSSPFSFHDVIGSLYDNRGLNYDKIVEKLKIYQ